MINLKELVQQIEYYKMITCKLRKIEDVRVAYKNKELVDLVILQGRKYMIKHYHKDSFILNKGSIWRASIININSFGQYSSIIFNSNELNNIMNNFLLKKGYSLEDLSCTYDLRFHMDTYKSTWGILE